MKTLPKEDAVAKLVGHYAKRLNGLDARSLRAEWDVVFGDEFPETPAETLALLTQDHAEWMGALEALELEAVWEDQFDETVQITDKEDKKPRKKKVA